MPTKNKKPTRTKTKTTKAAPAKVAKKAPAKAAKPPAAPRASAGACDGRCRVCGDVCVRAGLHEQHRCSDHYGLSA